jgi:uncharacterized membrane protein YjfL (UPF0719 family)
MDLSAIIEIKELLGTMIYTFVGVGLMWVVWKVLDLLTPYPIKKEIEEDQNMALAVLVGMLFLAISIIIAAVILS